MGNCLALIRSNRNFWQEATGDQKLLRIVKTDGKILEYRAAFLVKDVLVNFDGYGIGVSKRASQHLPSNYQLKVGHMYYLRPAAASAGHAVERSSPDGNSTLGLKRIKVIISKQQLQELMAQKVSVEEVLSGLQKGGWEGIDPMTSWRPTLETIPEGSEQHIM